MNKQLTAVCLLAALTLTGCGSQSDGVSILNSSTVSTQEATRPDIPDGAIVDESGDFYYEGKLQQVGDDENGYIRIPLGYVPFQEEDIEGLTQYSDVTGANIITLDHYDDVDYQTLGESLRYYLAEDENLEGLSGGVTTPAGYNALQLYGHYTDGYYVVIWLIEDPAAPSDSYYLAMEFDNEHEYLIACSSTFQTVTDYHAANGE